MIKKVRHGEEKIMDLLQKQNLKSTDLFSDLDFESDLTDALQVATNIETIKANLKTVN